MRVKTKNVQQMSSYKLTIGKLVLYITIQEGVGEFADMIAIMDASGSMQKHYFGLETITKKAQAAGARVIILSTTSTLIEPESVLNWGRLGSAVGGTTNYRPAIEMLPKLITPNTHIMFMTDGKPSDGPKFTAVELKSIHNTLKSGNGRFFTVYCETQGYGSPDKELLCDMSYPKQESENFVASQIETFIRDKFGATIGSRRVGDTVHVGPFSVGTTPTLFTQYKPLDMEGAVREPSVALAVTAALMEYMKEFYVVHNLSTLPRVIIALLGPFNVSKYACYGMERLIANVRDLAAALGTEKAAAVDGASMIFQAAGIVVGKPNLSKANAALIDNALTSSKIAMANNPTKQQSNARCKVAARGGDLAMTIKKLIDWLGPIVVREPMTGVCIRVHPAAIHQMSTLMSQVGDNPLATAIVQNPEVLDCTACGFETRMVGEQLPDGMVHLVTNGQSDAVIVGLTKLAAVSAFNQHLLTLRSPFFFLNAVFGCVDPKQQLAVLGVIKKYLESCPNPYDLDAAYMFGSSMDKFPIPLGARGCLFLNYFRTKPMYEIEAATQSVMAIIHEATGSNLPITADLLTANMSWQLAGITPEQALVFLSDRGNALTDLFRYIDRIDVVIPDTCQVFNEVVACFSEVKHNSPDGLAQPIPTWSQIVDIARVVGMSQLEQGVEVAAAKLALAMMTEQGVMTHPSIVSRLAKYQITTDGFKLSVSNPSASQRLCMMVLSKWLSDQARALPLDKQCVVLPRLGIKLDIMQPLGDFDDATPFLAVASTPEVVKHVVHEFCFKLRPDQLTSEITKVLIDRCTALASLGGLQVTPALIASVDQLPAVETKELMAKLNPFAVVEILAGLSSPKEFKLTPAVFLQVGALVHGSKDCRLLANACFIDTVFHYVGANMHELLDSDDPSEAQSYLAGRVRHVLSPDLVAKYNVRETPLGAKLIAESWMVDITRQHNLRGDDHPTIEQILSFVTRDTKRSLISGHGWLRINMRECNRYENFLALRQRLLMMKSKEYTGTNMENRNIALQLLPGVKVTVVNGRRKYEAPSTYEC